MAEFNQRETLRLPTNATLDESYQQKRVRATNGKSGAHSSMRAEDVPKGILIIPHGKSDEVYEQGWAVSDPQLKALSRDGSGKVGNTGANPQFGDCTVDVEVCYKPLR